VRRLAAFAVALTLACASIQAPPGGPLRTVPPVLLSVTPDSGALNVKADKVVFSFDEVINDRPSGTLLDNLFVVSPVQGQPDVSWKRSRIEVKPHKGFQPNVAYSVSLLPGIADQRGNVLREGRTVIFSTGGEIPQYSIDGRVFDWMRAVVAPNALVQAIRADSLTWLAVADSEGQFSVGPIPKGNYVVRAIIDNNKNRALDPGEPFDTISVFLADTLPFLELLAAPRDTGGPRIVTATPGDSVSIAVSFDRPVATNGLDAASYRVVAADSSPLHVIRVLTKAAAQARADSAQRDSTARADTTHAPALPPARVSAAIPARRDTSARAIRPSRPAPPIEIVVLLDPATTLRPGASYRITAVQVRSISGYARTSDREFTFQVKAPATTPAAGATAPATRPPATTTAPLPRPPRS
jgi:hypothetical protein